LSEAACKTLAEEITTRESKVDVLINNSGVAWGRRYREHARSGCATKYCSRNNIVVNVIVLSAAWTKVLSLNVTSPFHLTRYLLPLLDEAATSSDAARVINVGSIAGLMPQMINTIAYDTSKAAVHHMTRVLAAKLARRPNGGHILVNAIAPGLVPSKMSKGIAFVTGKSFKEMQQFLPVERVGQDSDMAGLAIFLASKASGWITGMVIACDGGEIGAAETGVGPAKL
jgi:NAD(P)-dependent dehydrogenase (short-subunit alcohol dehydrogenase family)